MGYRLPTPDLARRVARAPTQDEHARWSQSIPSSTLNFLHPRSLHSFTQSTQSKMASLWVRRQPSWAGIVNVDGAPTAPTLPPVVRCLDRRGQERRSLKFTLK